MVPSDPTNQGTVQSNGAVCTPKYHTTNGFVVVGAAERTSAEGLTVVIVDALRAVQALGLAQV